MGALSGVIACVPAESLELSGAASFNEKIRADAAPLTQVQQDDPPWVEFDGKAYFSDGGPDLKEIVSDVVHSKIESDRLADLRESRCLFVESAGFPVLSYEAIVEGFEVTDYEVNTDVIGTCGGYPNNPVTRRIIEIDGKKVSVAYDLGITIGLSAYEGNEEGRNPYAECDGVRPSNLRSVTGTEDLVGGADGSFPPLCLIQGAPADLPVEDTTYVVDLVDKQTLGPGPNTGITSFPYELTPSLKLVGIERRVARPLTFEGTTFDTDKGLYVHTWTWSVENVDGDGNFDPDGRFWLENYAPTVLVESVRFFVQDGFDPTPEVDRQYVPIRKLRVVEIGDIGPQEAVPYNEGCSIGEAGDPDEDGSLYLAGCEITATPTYALTPDANGRITEKVEWRASFRTAGPNDFVPVEPDENFHIEFRLRAPVSGSQSASLLVDPGYVNFGAGNVGEERVDRTMEIENVGFSAGVVESIRVEGRDAARFGFELPSNMTPPFVVTAGTTVPVDVKVTATQQGYLQAQLVVVWANANLALQDSRASLYAQGIAPDLRVLPSRLSLYRGTYYGSSYYWQKSFLIQNAGSATLDRSTISISGAYRSSFSVYSSDCGGKIQIPAPATCRLQPGEMEVVKVLYHPGRPGVHTANVLISSTDGPGTVGLTGTCYSGCYYGAPKTTTVASPYTGITAKPAGTSTTLSTSPSKTTTGIITTTTTVKKTTTLKLSPLKPISLF